MGEHGDEVVGGFEGEDGADLVPIAAEIAGEQADESVAHAEAVAGLQEQEAERGGVDAVDEPGKAAHGAADVAFHADGLGAAGRGVGEPGIGDVGAHFARGHGEQDAAAEHGIEEREGVADHQEPVAMGAVGIIGVVAGADHVGHQSRAAHAVADGRRGLDTGQEAVGRGSAGGLERGLVADEADAHDVVGERDEPEPAVLGEMHADIAFMLAGAAFDAVEMGVEGGGVVPLVGAFGAQAAGHEGVAAGGVQDEAGGEVLGTVRTFGFDEGAVVAGLERGDAGVLVDARAAVGGGLEQEVVEVGAGDLPARGEALIEPLGEGELDGAAGVVGDELGAGLVDADGGDAVADAEAVEDGGVEREQRLADVEARVFGLFEQHHVPPAFGEEGCGGGAGRAAADDENVALGGCHAMPPLIEMTCPVI